MAKQLVGTKKERDQLKYEKIMNARKMGIHAHRKGKPDVNPFGVNDMMEMCAWSSGYFDSMRGMV